MARHHASKPSCACRWTRIQFGAARCRGRRHRPQRGGLCGTPRDQWSHPSQPVASAPAAGAPEERPLGRPGRATPCRNCPPAHNGAMRSMAGENARASAGCSSQGDSLRTRLASMGEGDPSTTKGKGAQPSLRLGEAPLQGARRPLCPGERLRPFPPCGATPRKGDPARAGCASSALNALAAARIRLANQRLARRTTTLSTLAPAARSRRFVQVAGARWIKGG